MPPTRQRILQTARELFNRHGLHRVGVRDIARALDLSPGNLAYHFATKDDLVAALVTELHRVNQESAFGELPADFSLLSLYETAVIAMRNMLEYRFVLLSYADAVLSSPELQALEADLAPRRRARNDDLIDRLVRGGYVDRRTYAPRAQRLYEQGQALSTGWLTLAALHPGHRGDRGNVLHYAQLGVALLEPHLTAKGARQLGAILAGEHDRIAWRSSGAPRG